jgi:DNA-binding CsgD family transcriptional regulator
MSSDRRRQCPAGTSVRLLQSETGSDLLPPSGGPAPRASQAPDGGGPDAPPGDRGLGSSSGAGKRRQGPARRRVPPVPPEPGAPLRVGVLSRVPEQEQRVEALLRRMDGVEVVDPETGRPHVRVLAVSSPEEAVALVDIVDVEWEARRPVERIPEPHPRTVLLVVAGRLGPEDAGLYGCLGFLTMTMEVPQERQLACLRSVAAGAHDAPDPYGTLFHNSLWRGSLTPLGRQILHRAAQGATHEQMIAELHLGKQTLDRHVHDLRVRLDLERHDHLWRAAQRRGFGA